MCHERGSGISHQPPHPRARRVAAADLQLDQRTSSAAAAAGGGGECAIGSGGGGGGGGNASVGSARRNSVRCLR